MTSDSPRHPILLDCINPARHRSRASSPTQYVVGSAGCGGGNAKGLFDLLWISGRRRRAFSPHVEVRWRNCRRFFCYSRAVRLCLSERKGFTTVRNLVLLVYA